MKRSLFNLFLVGVIAGQLFMAITNNLDIDPMFSYFLIVVLKSFGVYLVPILVTSLAVLLYTYLRDRTERTL